MKVENSSIAMYSKHTYAEKYERSEILRFRSGSRGPRGGETNTRPVPIPDIRDEVEISPQAKSTGSVEDCQYLEDKLTDEDKMKITLVEKLIEMLTGKKVKIKVPKLSEKDSEDKARELQSDLAKIKSGQGKAEQEHGWGLVYDLHERYEESEKTSFSAAGIINTTDGREIAFSVDLSMSRTFIQEQNINIRAGDAEKIDPLVINFGGSAAELTNTKFSFDLDTDGSEDQVSFVKPGSGFLAADSNEDGTVNNGSELFGPETGNGFMELAAYDEDSNNWIDENDSIFSKLRIWTKDEQGNDTLFALAEKGIGAIYLDNTDSLFALKNSNNESLGQISRTGVFLKENGTAGTIQQVDLTV